MGLRFGPDFPKETYIPHAFEEVTIDLGEVVMNYAVAGEESAPALLLLPAQAESWWAYEAAMQKLAADYRVYAVDLRGQGRTTRTPGRYTVDNIANDVVRFIQLVIGRPTIVAGNSSGGVVAAWLAAYAPPGLVRGVYLEDAPIFSSELTPACGNGLHQSAVSNLFWLFSTYLGDQWSIGDWEGMIAAAPSKIPPWVLAWIAKSDGPPQNLKEYDPEWGRAFLSGTATAGCSHKEILQSVKVPMLFTHHYRGADPVTGELHGVASDLQVNYARTLVEKAGQRFDYQSLPDKTHALHEAEPELYVSILKEWAKGLV